MDLIKFALLIGIFGMICIDLSLGNVLYQENEEISGGLIDQNGNFKVLAFAGPMRKGLGRIVRDSRAHEGSLLANNGFHVPYNPGAEEFYTDGSYKGEKIYWFKGKRIYW